MVEKEEKRSAQQAITYPCSQRYEFARERNSCEKTRHSARKIRNFNGICVYTATSLDFESCFGWSEKLSGYLKAEKRKFGKDSVHNGARTIWKKPLPCGGVLRLHVYFSLSFMSTWLHYNAFPLIKFKLLEKHEYDKIKKIKISFMNHEKYHFGISTHRK